MPFIPAANLSVFILAQVIKYPLTIINTYSKCMAKSESSVTKRQKMERFQFKAGYYYYYYGGMTPPVG